MDGVLDRFQNGIVGWPWRSIEDKNITLDPSIEQTIATKVQNGEFENADELVKQALQCFFDLDHYDLVETAAAIEEA